MNKIGLSCLGGFFRADGVIVKTFANNFDALSQDGELTVVVQNTGLVTADFYVRKFFSLNRV